MKSASSISEANLGVKQNRGGWVRYPQRLAHSTMSLGAKALYPLLRSFHGASGCFPSQETLWTALQCSKASLNRWLKDLEDAGLIVRRQAWVQAGDSKRFVCLYTFPADMSEVSAERLQSSSEVSPMRLQSSEVSPERLQNASEVSNNPRVKSHQRPTNKIREQEYISCSSSDEREGDFRLEAEPGTPTLKSRAKPQALSASQGQWFTDFWSRYPRKIAKADAEKSFRREVKTASDFTLMLSGLERDLQSGGPLDKVLEFQPYPATWIRRKDWRTPVDVAKPAQSAAESIKAARATDTRIDWSKA